MLRCRVTKKGHGPPLVLVQHGLGSQPGLTEITHAVIQRANGDRATLSPFCAENIFLKFCRCVFLQYETSFYFDFQLPNKIYGNGKKLSGGWLKQGKLRLNKWRIITFASSLPIISPPSYPVTCTPSNSTMTRRASCVSPVLGTLGSAWRPDCGPEKRSAMSTRAVTRKYGRLIRYPKWPLGSAVCCLVEYHQKYLKTKERSIR